MSSILEALEKAEEERLKGAGPVMRAAADEHRGRRVNGRMAAIVVTLILLLNLVIWFFYLQVRPEVEAPIQAQTAPEMPPPAPDTPPPVVEAQPALSVEPPRQALSVREQLRRTTPPSTRPLISEAVVARPPPRPKPLEVSPAPPVTSPQIELRSTGSEETGPNETVAAARKIAPPSPSPSPPPRRQMAVPEAQPAPIPIPLPAEDAVEPPPVVVEEQQQAEDQIPLVWELPQIQRENVLQLKSSVHVYSDTPSQRFVIINMKRYGEGDLLPPYSYRLKRIERDGVVIDYGEGLVRLPRR